MNATYRIADEPRPSARAHLSVSPIWPFFALIFGGAGVSWPWYAFNGYVVGSPTRARELRIALAGFAGTVILVVAMSWFITYVGLPTSSAPYFRLVILLWKIGVTYWLFTLQSRSFEIYEYYGGKVSNGMIVVLAVFFIWGRLESRLLEISPILYFVLS